MKYGRAKPYIYMTVIALRKSVFNVNILIESEY